MYYQIKNYFMASPSFFTFFSQIFKSLRKLIIVFIFIFMLFLFYF